MALCFSSLWFVLSLKCLLLNFTCIIGPWWALQFSSGYKCLFHIFVSTQISITKIKILYPDAQYMCKMRPIFIRRSLRGWKVLHPFTFFALTVFWAIKKKTGQGPPIGSAHLPLKASLNFMLTSGSSNQAVFLPQATAHKRYRGCKDTQQTAARWSQTFPWRTGACTYLSLS